MFLHICFVIVHIGCLMFGFVGLFVSIPLHILFTILKGQRKKLDEQTDLMKEQNDLMKEQLKEKEK
ncbi:hypothetical protein N9P72_02415 [Amylibacter sp.]|nr:hypothetical protein [Amylibacter sp.]